MRAGLERTELAGDAASPYHCLSIYLCPVVTANLVPLSELLGRNLQRSRRNVVSHSLWQNALTYGRIRSQDTCCV